MSNHLSLNGYNDEHLEVKKIHVFIYLTVIAERAADSRVTSLAAIEMEV